MNDIPVVNQKPVIVEFEGGVVAIDPAIVANVLVIGMDPSTGQVKAHGNLANRVWIYGLAEVAKDLARDQAEKLNDHGGLVLARGLPRR